MRKNDWECCIYGTCEHADRRKASKDNCVARSVFTWVILVCIKLQNLILEYSDLMKKNC